MFWICLLFLLSGLIFSYLNWKRFKSFLLANILCRVKLISCNLMHIKCFHCWAKHNPLTHSRVLSTCYNTSPVVLFSSDIRRRKRRIKSVSENVTETAKTIGTETGKNGNVPPVRRAKTRIRRETGSQTVRRQMWRYKIDLCHAQTQSSWWVSSFSMDVSWCHVTSVLQVTRDYDEEEQGYDSEREEERERNSDAASSPPVKEPHADSADDVGRGESDGNSEDQRDEDMDMSDWSDAVPLISVSAYSSVIWMEERWSEISLESPMNWFIPVCFLTSESVCCIYWYMPVLNMYSQCFRAVSFLMANVEVCYTVYLESAVGFFLNKIHRVLVSLEFYLT